VIRDEMPGRWERGGYLSVKIQQIKAEKDDFDGDLIELDILPLPRTQNLKRQ
jgi:hypothetical protein